MRRRNQADAEARALAQANAAVVFIGVDQATQDLYWTLTERFRISIADIARIARRLVMMQLNPELDLVPEVRTETSVPTPNSDVDPFVAMDRARWHQQIAAKMLERTPKPTLTELFWIQQMYVDWFRFFAARDPRPEARLRFARDADALEQDLFQSRIRAKAPRPRLRLVTGSKENR
jgi:hypothetical protein